MRTLIAQFARFGVVGAVGFVVDVSLFNLLRGTIFAPEAHAGGPIWAKVISTTVAIILNWLGNRYWTFRHHRRTHPVREGIDFAIVSLGGLLIALICLWFSHYVLGLTSTLADNISSNGFGLVLGTLFRFAFYRIWVFRPEHAAKEVEVPAEARAAHVPTHLAGPEHLATTEPMHRAGLEAEPMHRAGIEAEPSGLGATETAV